MKVMSAPLGLRLASSMLFLAIPLAGFEAAIILRMPWWKLPWHEIGIGSASVAAVCVPLVVWLMNGRRWAFQGTLVLAYTWALLTAWLAIRLRYPALGFFTVFLLIYLVVLLFWMRFEIGRSFLDPQLKWYQGFPKPIPDLKCQLATTEEQADCRVSRLDREGAFIFSDAKIRGGGAGLPFLRPREKTELTFRFRDLQFRCQGVPMAVLESRSGGGFQFQGLTPDMNKELGDFIEQLRGEGYVE